MGKELVKADSGRGDIRNIKPVNVNVCTANIGDLDMNLQQF